MYIVRSAYVDGNAFLLPALYEILGDVLGFSQCRNDNVQIFGIVPKLKVRHLDGLYGNVNDISERRFRVHLSPLLNPWPHGSHENEVSYRRDVMHVESKNQITRCGWSQNVDKLW